MLIIGKNFANKYCCLKKLIKVSFLYFNNLNFDNFNIYCISQYFKVKINLIAKIILVKINLKFLVECQCFNVNQNISDGMFLNLLFILFKKIVIAMVGEYN